MPLTRLLLTVLLIFVCFTAQAVNVLRGRHAAIEAPAGVAYDREMSEHTGMEVYRDDSVVLCMDSQIVPEGVNASSITAALVREIIRTSPELTVNDAACKATMNDGRILNIVFDNARGRIYALTDVPSGVLSVIFVGSIPRADALRYLATLKM